MNKTEQGIPVDLLRELLRLDPETGRLFWQKRSAVHFSQTGKRPASHSANNWNSIYAGTKALNCVDQFGHLMGRIFSRTVYAHRAVFALTHGSWPVYEIDHINGVPSDNRPSNLRDVPHQDNIKNQKLGAGNTSGAVGVNRFKRDGNWVASITINGKSKHLGYFDSFENAAAARKIAEAAHGFHENHGRRSA